MPTRSTVVSSSRAGAGLCAGRAILFASIVLLSSGCWTGYVYQASRIHEAAVGYSAAWSNGRRLVLVYEVAVTHASGEPIATELRAAEFRLDDLAAHPEIPVNEFPATALDLPPQLGPDDRPVPITATPDAPALEHTASAALPGAASLLLTERARDGRVESLELFAVPADGARPDRVGRLYSDALFRERTAWWAYACLPVAGAVDLALIPVQLATAWPLFLFGR